MTRQIIASAEGMLIHSAHALNESCLIICQTYQKARAFALSFAQELPGKGKIES